MNQDFYIFFPSYQDFLSLKEHKLIINILFFPIKNRVHIIYEQIHVVIYKTFFLKRECKKICIDYVMLMYKMAKGEKKTKKNSSILKVRQALKFSLIILNFDIKIIYEHVYQ